MSLSEAESKTSFATQTQPLSLSSSSVPFSKFQTPAIANTTETNSVLTGPPSSANPILPRSVVIGATVGCIVVIIAIICMICYQRKKRKVANSKKEKAQRGNTNTPAFQNIECVYPMSGQYGRAPRALYYFLLMFIVVLQKQNWLVAGAAASCLITGGSASIHAFVLTSILSLGKTSTPDGVVEFPNSTIVIVQVLVIDLDSDATLAIVGSGFLVALPMAIWSAEFRRPGIVQILAMWALLMFAGMICCLINLYAIDGSSSGPLRQFRFCTPNYQDTMPYNGVPISVMKGTWNETVWAYFDGEGTLTPSCIYPCLNARELLRQPGDAQVVKFPDVRSPDSVYYWTIEIFAATVYGCVPLSILLGLVLVVMRLRGDKVNGWASIDPENSLRRQVSTFIAWVINIYGYILTSFVFVVFLVWVEWIISFDLQSESMHLVGQWTPLLGVVLVFVAAFIGKLWPERGSRVSGSVP